jgi:hypothetical protein
MRTRIRNLFSRLRERLAAPPPERERPNEDNIMGLVPRAWTAQDPHASAESRAQRSTSQVSELDAVDSLGGFPGIFLIQYLDAIQELQGHELRDQVPVFLCGFSIKGGPRLWRSELRIFVFESLFAIPFVLSLVIALTTEIGRNFEPVVTWLILLLVFALQQLPVNVRAVCLLVSRNRRAVLAVMHTNEYMFARRIDILLIAWHMLGAYWILALSNVDLFAYSRTSFVYTYAFCTSAIALSIVFVRMVLIAYHLSTLLFPDRSARVAIERENFANALRAEARWRARVHRLGDEDIWQPQPRLRFDSLEPCILFKDYRKQAQGPDHALVCSICLSEFEPEDELRRLPCHHVFHALCVDKWLCQVSRCPLRCMVEPLTEPPQIPAALLDLVTPSRPPGEGNSEQTEETVGDGERTSPLPGSVW